jgi:superfamily II DNA or RNA helicase
MFNRVQQDMDVSEIEENNVVSKKLYPYQEIYIERILSALIENEKQENIVFQLPTGGGKTVIFSEISRKYIEKKQKKILVLTHRIELLKQTARALEEANVHCKLITSETDNVLDQDEYMCFLAMVETLNNRLKDDETFLKDIDLVIVDEAHYNSFRKIFKYFENTVILGVTATPLSSNIHYPLRYNYKKLIVGDSIMN